MASNRLMSVSCAIVEMPVLKKHAHLVRRANGLFDDPVLFAVLRFATVGNVQEATPMASYIDSHSKSQE